MELEERAFGAAAAAGADERAPPEVAQQDGALDLGRDVARSGALRLTARACRWPRTSSGRVRQQHRERAVQDRRFVPGGNGVAQHVPGEPQLLERLGADRELEPVAVRRERGDRPAGIPAGHRHDADRGNRDGRRGDRRGGETEPPAPARAACGG